MKIWVVMGGSGEYSDRREWPVRAYADMAEVQRQIVLLTEKGRELSAERDRLRESEDESARWYDFPSEEMRKTLPDPCIEFDYTGVSYFYYEVDLVTTEDGK